MAFLKKPAIAIIAVSIVGLLLASLTTGVLSTPRGSGGVSAQNVGVYSDPGCMISCTFIEWGNISPGSIATKTVYVKNTGDTTVTLSISTSNWKPRIARSVLTLSWNLNSYLLAAGKAVTAVLTLAAASKVGSLTNFTFTIVITGTR